MGTAPHIKNFVQIPHTPEVTFSGNAGVLPRFYLRFSGRAGILRTPGGFTVILLNIFGVRWGFTLIFLSKVRFSGHTGILPWFSVPMHRTYAPYLCTVLMHRVMDLKKSLRILQIPLFQRISLRKLRIPGEISQNPWNLSESFIPFFPRIVFLSKFRNFGQISRNPSDHRKLRNTGEISQNPSIHLKIEGFSRNLSEISQISFFPGVIFPWKLRA